MTLVIDGLRKRFGEVQALDGVGFACPAGGGLRVPRRERRRQDDDDADRPRLPPGRRRDRDLEGPAGPDAGRAGPGATCPRSAASTCGCRSSSSSSSSPRCTACRAGSRARTRSHWLARFRIAEFADRKAESLSKGNQQKVQYIATILHDPDVLLMDEPFVGLDPVNVALLKSAFLEMRDRGKTLIFSTHQLDQAEELCDSVAIIDHGRIVTAGSTREVKRSTGHQVVRVATSGDGDLAWLRSLPHVTVTRPGQDYTELQVDAGADPQAVLRAAMARGGDVLRFEVADPSLEEVFVERVGALDVEERTLAAAEVRS